MLTFSLDTITKDPKTEVFTAYVLVMDDQEIIQTISLNYNNDESFEEILRMKSAKTKEDYDEKKEKKGKIEKILGRM